MIKGIGDNYKIYGLTIIKIAKKITSGRLWTFNATFEPPNHAFDHLHVPLHVLLGLFHDHLHERLFHPLQK
jgi:hypothetical protein